MNLLLDTHTFLWHSDGNPPMNATATALLVDPANELFLSMATVGKIGISRTGSRKTGMLKVRALTRETI